VQDEITQSIVASIAGRICVLCRALGAPPKGVPPLRSFASALVLRRLAARRRHDGLARLLGEMLPSEGTCEPRASFRRPAQGGHAGLIRLQAIEQLRSVPGWCDAKLLQIRRVR
jgi:hypothetical protein